MKPTFSTLGVLALLSACISGPTHGRAGDPGGGWLELLAGTPTDIGPDALQTWSRRCGLAVHPNPEIRCAFLVLALDRGLSAVSERAADFVRASGRPKFVLPIFQALAESPEGLARTRQLSQEAQPRMHFITSNSVAKILR